MREIKATLKFLGFAGVWWLSLNAGLLIQPQYAATTQLVATISWWLIVISYGIHILRSDR